MNNFEENKKIALFVVNFISKMYHLDDAVLVDMTHLMKTGNVDLIVWTHL